MLGRNSDAYAQMLYNRFLAKYQETASIMVQCTALGCTHFKVVRANTAPIYLQNIRKYYLCDECEYCESSMDEEPDSQ
jgi:hypothetical protein